MLDHAWIDVQQYRHEELIREAQQECLRQVCRAAQPSGCRRVSWPLGRAWATLLRLAGAGYRPVS
jgi:hypothetical protein